MKTPHIPTILAALLTPCLSVSAAPEDTVTDTPLDRYTAQRDDSYRYELLRSYDTPASKGHALRLTSQTWRTPEEVSHPEWTHVLQIVVPDLPSTETLPSTALLFIGDGTRRQGTPNAIRPELALMASMTGSIVVYIPNVPNQPMTLNNDGALRYEDNLLAESWITAAAKDDPSWVVHLAMVESAVAAMDAAQEFLASDEGGNIGIDDFFVTGASKRGWTSWLTAAVDDRIAGVIPIVIDVMNLPKMAEHHWGAYGFWAPALHDYADREVFELIRSDKGRAIREIVDPYLYRDRYTMPKFILNAAGDQFFLPDTTRHFLSDLPGLTRIRVVPNADHAVYENLDAVQSALGFYTALVNNRDIPELNETPGAPGVVSVTPDTRPYEVRLWQAHNPDARDFRRQAIGDVWRETALLPDEKGTYTATVETPEEGFRAYFIETRFRPEKQALPLVFTTEVRVVPDVFPFADTPIGNTPESED